LDQVASKDHNVLPHQLHLHSVMSRVIIENEFLVSAAQFDANDVQQIRAN